MWLGERLLAALSVEPGHEYRPGTGGGPADPLAALRRVYPGFDAMVAGKRVLDFGCGEGHQSVALAEIGANVVGVENNPRTLTRAREMLARSSVQDRVTFVESLASSDEGRFDVVISKDSMEHFSDPAAILRLMVAALAPDGKLLITFGPPWYAPYGSHANFFTKVPWVQLWFSERTVMRVRARYRSDGAMRYEDVESGLNKMSLRKFERLVADAGLSFAYRRYDCVKGVDVLGKIPLVRELFVNQVSCILQR
jgi:SAM-dependent methyltransferase